MALDSGAWGTRQGILAREGRGWLRELVYSMLLDFQEPPCHPCPAATAAQEHPKHRKACRGHGVLL